MIASPPSEVMCKALVGFQGRGFDDVVKSNICDFSHLLSPYFSIGLRNKLGFPDHIEE